ncbi:DUF4329 domain-containing protein [Nereida sp. MMG025]|uniref:DUF4329 domain-containing protein n=1 Tax=Nereida sp. MMG025 TaxID=2909981 RepID=UPI001F1EAA03|nr:DUF4329 domain-containing protein [Nereida sp. MMG025]MCF6444951.1 DUF4329 domain-containing protein [Nereida sp. MMG025]
MFCATQAVAQDYDPQVMQVARDTLAKLQANSFAANREYCGLIGRDDAGNLIVTRARKGRKSSCRPRSLPHTVEPIASYHTHGRYTPRDDTEVPSYQDIEGDMADGVNGYIATPGGRFWFVDGQMGLAYLLCDIGCLPSDPRFRRETDPDFFVADRYTIDALKARQD